MSSWQSLEELKEQLVEPTKPFASIHAIENAVCDLKGSCVSCGLEFHRGDVHSYDHDGGVSIKGRKEKQWVYFSCRGCGYDSALWKVLSRISQDLSKERTDGT